MMEYIVLIHQINIYAKETICLEMMYTTNLKPSELLFGWPVGNKIWLNNAMMGINTFKGEKIFRKQG